MYGNGFYGLSRENYIKSLISNESQVIKCIAGMRPDGDICVPGSEECKITNALVAEMVWDETSGDYGKCIVKECVSGYHIASNQCVPDTRTCDVENGSGFQEWNYDTNTWNECIVTSCEPGYTNDRFESDTPNKPCGRCRNAYDKEGNIAVSTYVRECEIGACMYQGELYALENNECCNLFIIQNAIFTIKFNIFIIKT